MRKKWISFTCVAIVLVLLIPGALAGEAPDARQVATSAEYIDLGDAKISDWEAFYAFLLTFPSLKKVDMFATPVNRKQIDELVQRFPEVEFGWTIQFAEHTVRTDATAFSTLHYGGSKTHSTEVLSVLKYCKNLRALDIGHNAADDLSFIASLTELRVLIIACNRFTDISLLKNLEHLEYLEMFSNYVEDITPLKELPYLAHLNIGYNNIRDFSPLYEMQGLKRLWMKKCHGRPKVPPIGKDVIETLQNALGDCVINTTSNPSEGGWRDSIYYETFHEYFQTGEYAPFPDGSEENR